MIHVVRHAEPAVLPEVPPDRWRLTPAGAAAAAALATALPADAYLVASPEPKARQTLEPAGPVTTDPRLAEVHRDEPYGGDFRARRAAYVGGTDHPAWERRDGVAARFAAAVAAHRVRAADRPLVVGSHGMALTVWLATVVDLPDPAAFWAALRFPDLLLVDSATRTVRRADLPAVPPGTVRRAGSPAVPPRTGTALPSHRTAGGDPPREDES